MKLGDTIQTIYGPGTILQIHKGVMRVEVMTEDGVREIYVGDDVEVDVGGLVPIDF